VATGKIEPIFMEWNERQNSDTLCSMAMMAVYTDFAGLDETIFAMVLHPLLATVLRRIERPYRA
jgi:hypothetical protein